MLLVCGVLIRRWLVLWTIIALVYQIDYYKIHIKELARIGLIVFIFEFFVHIELFLFNFIEDVPVYVVKTGKYAHNLGMPNSNQVGMLTLDFCVLIYLYYGICKKYKLKVTLILFSLGFVMFYFTSCRTAYYSILLIILLSFCYWNNLFFEWSKYIVCILPLFLFFTIFYAAINYSELGVINELTTGRIWLMTKYLDDFSSGDYLIGSVIETSDPLDGSYLELILKGGAILCASFSIMFLFSTLINYSKIKPYLPIIITTLIAGLSETMFSAPAPSSIILWMFTLYSVIAPKPIY